MVEKISQVKQKDILLNYFLNNLGEEKVRQCDLLKEVGKILDLLGKAPKSGFAESLRGTFFRTAHKYFLITQYGFKRTVINKCVYWSKGISEKLVHNYEKPKEYKEFLIRLPGKRVISMPGTTGHCLPHLSNRPFLLVDQSKLVVKTSNISNIIHGDIFKIKHSSNDLFDLDFEGRITEKRISNINSLKAKYIILTHKPDKNSELLLTKLEYKIIESHDYKSGTKNMNICALERV